MPRSGEFEFGFAVDWMRKDLGHGARPRPDRQRRATARWPRWSTSSHGEVQAMGGARWDTSSLLARLEK